MFLSEVKCKSLSCVRLFDPMYYTVCGILKARILEGVALPFSRGLFQPRDRTQVSHITGRFFTSWATRKESEVAQLCPTLCDPMDCSSPGSSIHGIFWARILEWVAISFSRGSKCLFVSSSEDSAPRAHPNEPATLTRPPYSISLGCTAHIFIPSHRPQSHHVTCVLFA